MRVATVLAVFASGVLAQKTLVQLKLDPAGAPATPGTSLVPSIKLLGNAIKGWPHFQPHDKTAAKDVNDKVLAACQTVPECTSTGIWASDVGSGGSTKHWTMILFKGDPPTAADFVVDTSNTHPTDAQYFVQQNSKTKQAHVAH